MLRASRSCAAPSLRFRACSAAAAALLALILSGCGLLDESPNLPTRIPTTMNRLANPGFENGDTHWIAPPAPDSISFAVSDIAARSGDASGGLRMSAAPGETGSRVAGASQEIVGSDFPEVVSGYYHVDDWQPGGTPVYLQFVVAVDGGDFADSMDVHEVRFVIAGIQQEPLFLPQARYVFLDRAAPKIDRWTYFAYPAKKAFETRWGSAPTTWQRLRVSFELRYDDRMAEHLDTSATAHYDDLYAGTQIDNPNRPD
jgi:hypothetical protein